LRGNFTPIPDLLFDVLLKAGLSREELLVTLFLVHGNYEFEKTMTLVPLESIVEGTDLDEAGVLRGLRAALARGTVLQFHTESSSQPKSFYLLNTEENLRVMGPMQPEPSLDDDEAYADTPAPGPSPSPWAVFTQDSPPAPAPVARPVPPTPPPPVPPVPARAEIPVNRPGLSVRVLERIVTALGRDLTKDERERLDELGANEAQLLQVMDNLEARQVELYSSDLVIYEYESVKTSTRRATEGERRRSEMNEAKQRQRTCKKCAGLGYIFIGVNVVEECVCRKTR
jgi:hypothetical protein